MTSSRHSPARDALFAHLRTLLDAENYPEIEKLTQPLCDNDPTDEEALCWLAQAVSTRKYFKRALFLTEKLLAMNPLHAAYYNNYGGLFAAQSQWTEAEAAYQMAMVLDPSGVDAPVNKAIAVFRQGRAHEALELLDALDKKSPGLANLAALRDDILRAQNEPAELLAQATNHPPLLFGDAALTYQLVNARHGWMLANPNDIYIGRALIDYGEYNEAEAAVLGLLYLQKPGRIIEVGANIGSHTVALAKAASKRGAKMDIFEPQAVLFQNVCANLALNGLCNVRAWPFACGNRAENLSFPDYNYGVDGNFGGIAMQKETQNVGYTTIKCVRLDDTVPHEETALIKIDVEGFELDVLKGSVETIAKWQPILYVENDQSDLSQALIEWLWSMNYRLFWHIPHLFNPDNFFRQEENFFGNTASFNMICLPTSLQLDGLSMPSWTEVLDSSAHPLKNLR